MTSIGVDPAGALRAIVEGLTTELEKIHHRVAAIRADLSEAVADRDETRKALDRATRALNALTVTRTRKPKKEPETAEVSQ